jgi:hypothetical protein
MADASDATGLVRRVLEANGRLYRGWIDLSLEYLRNVTEIVDPKPGPPPEPPHATGTLVLEAIGGETASAAFLMTNDLGRTLTCEPVASAFTGPDGASTRPKLTFEPSSVQLKPGEQRVIRTGLTIGAKLPAGVAYTGAINIKGMDGFAVPVVLRRREEPGGSPIDRAAEPTPAREKAARRKGAKKTGASRTKKKK